MVGSVVNAAGNKIVVYPDRENSGYLERRAMNSSHRLGSGQLLRLKVSGYQVPTYLGRYLSTQYTWAHELIFTSEAGNYYKHCNTPTTEI